MGGEARSGCRVYFKIGRIKIRNLDKHIRASRVIQDRVSTAIEPLQWGMDEIERLGDERIGYSIVMK